MAWHWADEGTPPGKTVKAGVGVLTVMDTPSAAQRPYAFVEGSDSHLWVRWWSATRWHCKDEGALPRTTAFSSEVMRKYAVAVCTMQRRNAVDDGAGNHLWVRW